MLASGNPPRRRLYLSRLEAYFLDIPVYHKGIWVGFTFGTGRTPLNPSCRGAQYSRPRACQFQKACLVDRCMFIPMLRSSLSRKVAFSGLLLLRRTAYDHSRWRFWMGRSARQVRSYDNRKWAALSICTARPWPTGPGSCSWQTSTAHQESNCGRIAIESANVSQQYNEFLENHFHKKPSAYPIGSIHFCKKKLGHSR